MSQTQEGKRSSWMKFLPPRLSSEPLKNIAIPGSHNSFSYFLENNSPIDPGSPNFVKKLSSVFGSFVRRIVKNWSMTQSLDLKQQLELGIRYFDFRIATWRDRGDLYFVHGLYGRKVIDGVKEILSWLQEHPTEIVLIDFNHFYKMTYENHCMLREMISETFKGKLCPSSVGIENVTLKQLWTKEWQVLVFYHHRTAKHAGFWPGNVIPSFWPNTTKEQVMQERLDERFKEDRPRNTFWISQGILTPTTGTVVKSPFNSLEKTLAKKSMKGVKSFLNDKSAGESGINIVITDFVEKDDFVATILALNRTF